MAKHNFTRKDILQIEKAESPEHARTLLLELIERSKLGTSKNPMMPRKTAFLKQRAHAHDTVERIAAIAWNMLLVGEGLGVKDSSYQRMMGSWK